MSQISSVVQLDDVSLPNKASPFCFQSHSAQRGLFFGFDSGAVQSPYLDSELKEISFDQRIVKRWASTRCRNKLLEKHQKFQSFSLSSETFNTLKGRCLHSVLWELIPLQGLVSTSQVLLHTGGAWMITECGEICLCRGKQESTPSAGQIPRPTLSYTFPHIRAYSHRFAQNIFIFPEILLTLKTQKMSNHANT